MSEGPVHERAPQGEWRKFIILVLILLGTILVIALLRPLIFGRIVPAILGENLEQAPITVTTPVEPTDEEGDTFTNETEEAMEEDTDDSDNEATNEPDEGSNDGEGEEVTEEAEESNEEESSEVETDTAVTTPTEQTHTVLSGQTVNQIAREYNITVNALVEANNITNPNVLRIGEELLIPKE